MEGIELAKTQQQMIVKMGGTLIETKKITVLGSFRYGVIDTSSTHSKVFSQPFALLKLSQFLQDTFSVCSFLSSSPPMSLCDLTFPPLFFFVFNSK